MSGFIGSVNIDYNVLGYDFVYCHRWSSCRMLVATLEDCTQPCWYDLLFSCANLGSFNVCHLKWSLKLSLCALVLLFFYMIDSQWSHVLWSHSLSSALATFKPPNYSMFLKNCRSYMLNLASSTLFPHLWIIWSHYNSSLGSTSSR